MQINRESFITILSTRKSGKSFLVANMIYNFLNNPRDNNCDLLYLFSNTAKFESSGHYDFIDKKCIFDANADIVEQVINKLMQIQLQTKKRHHILVVFDDIDLSSKYDQSIEKLATQGRHYNITTILSAQVATRSISPAIRNNTSYLFIRKLNSDALKKQIFNMIVNSDFDNAEAFKKFVNDNNHDYQFVMYDNNKDEKGVSIIKAHPIPKDFKYKVILPKQKKKPTIITGF